MKRRESGIGNREWSGRDASLRAVVPHSPFPIPHSRRPRSGGFTLIELMAVILLLAIALTIVSVGFSKSLQAAKVRAASRDLVAALRYTRGQAIVKGQAQALMLDLGENSYTAPGKGAKKLPPDMTLRLTTADTEVVGDHRGGIRFFPDGSSTGGHISVLLGQREWRINVAWLTGEIALDEKPE